MNKKELKKIRTLLQEADDWLDTPEGQAAMEEAEREAAHALDNAWKWRATI